MNLFFLELVCAKLLIGDQKSHYADNLKKNSQPLIVASPTGTLTTDVSMATSAAAANNAPKATINETTSGSLTEDVFMATTAATRNAPVSTMGETEVEEFLKESLKKGDEATLLYDMNIIAKDDFRLDDL